jgi:hypothetical protein
MNFDGLLLRLNALATAHGTAIQGHAPVGKSVTAPAVIAARPRFVPRRHRKFPLLKELTP